MEITINQVLEFEPSPSMLENLCKQVGEDFDKDQKFDVASLVSDEIELDNLTWLLAKMDKKLILVEIAIYSAEQVLHIYEKDNSSDAPRKAIQAAKDFLKDQSEENTTKAKIAAVHASIAANGLAIHATAANASAIYAAGTAGTIYDIDDVDTYAKAVAGAVYSSVAATSICAAINSNTDANVVEVIYDATTARNEIKDKILTKFIELINRG